MLSIGVSVGSKIAIGKSVVEVRNISTYPPMIIISVDGKEDTLITGEDQKEIIPHVFAQVGVGERGASNRLAFEAPRRIRISRIEGPRG